MTSPLGTITVSVYADYGSWQSAAAIQTRQVNGIIFVGLDLRRDALCRLRRHPVVSTGCPLADGILLHRPRLAGSHADK